LASAQNEQPTGLNYSILASLSLSLSLSPVLSTPRKRYFPREEAIQVVRSPFLHSSPGILLHLVSDKESPAGRRCNPPHTPGASIDSLSEQIRALAFFFPCLLHFGSSSLRFGPLPWPRADVDSALLGISTDENPSGFVDFFFGRSLKL
jgi:hypothetical protein